jgi:hypothetical protein
MPVKEDRAIGSGKRVYRTPRLKVHGDLRELTKLKGGTSNDNSGKPKTYQSGGKA